MVHFRHFSACSDDARFQSQHHISLFRRCLFIQNDFQKHLATTSLAKQIRITFTNLISGNTAPMCYLKNGAAQKADNPISGPYFCLRTPVYRHVPVLCVTSRTFPHRRNFCILCRRCNSYSLRFYLAYFYFLSFVVLDYILTSKFFVPFAVASKNSGNILTACIIIAVPP